MVPEPALPDSVTPADLDTDVRRDLRGLQKETAEKVARHLVAAGLLVDEDPEQALLHARYARRRASRIAVVREAAGIVAYHAGEWNEALGEFRAARRMGGGPGHVPVMADIERALGRPERALELTRGPEVRDLGEDERIELLIVAAGARRDLGELEAAVVGLQVAELDPSRREPWSVRLFYAYADNLLAVGRRAEAVQWFVHAHDADAGDETDAAARIAELTGDELPGSGDDGLMFGMEDTPVAEPARQPVDNAAEAGLEDAAPAETDHTDTDPVETDPVEADAATADGDSQDRDSEDGDSQDGDSPGSDEGDPDVVVDDTAESVAADVDGPPPAGEDPATADEGGPPAAEVLGVAPVEVGSGDPATDDTDEGQVVETTVVAQQDSADADDADEAGEVTSEDATTSEDEDGAAR